MISVVMDMMMFLIFLALVGAPSFGFSWISHVYKQFHPLNLLSIKMKYVVLME
jgi:hypothetical protein